jgi:hypothetical protein
MSKESISKKEIPTSEKGIRKKEKEDDDGTALSQYMVEWLYRHDLEEGELLSQKLPWSITQLCGSNVQSIKHSYPCLNIIYEGRVKSSWTGGNAPLLSRGRG